MEGPIGQVWAETAPESTARGNETKLSVEVKQRRAVDKLWGPESLALKVVL